MTFELRPWYHIHLSIHQWVKFAAHRISKSSFSYEVVDRLSKIGMELDLRLIRYRERF